MEIIRKPVKLYRLETIYAVYAHKVAHGTTIDHVLDGQYWVHVARDGILKVGDVIEVIAEDGSFELRMRVTDMADKRCPKFRVLWVWEPEARDQDEAADAPQVDAKTPLAGLIVSWGGPAQKHRIVDQASGDVVQAGFVSQVEALAERRRLASNRVAA